MPDMLKIPAAHVAKYAFLALEGHNLPRNDPEISCSIPLSRPDASL
jgi:hypothetical protein